MENNVNSNVVTTKISKKAIASLILSIINISTILHFREWHVISIVLAIILGIIARIQIKKSNGKLTGNKLALIGLYISYITVALMLFMIYIAMQKIHVK